MAYAVTLAIMRGSASEASGTHLLPHVTAHAQVMTLMHHHATHHIMYILKASGEKPLGICGLWGWYTCCASWQKIMRISGGGEGLTLLLSWLLMQAGVDLGSVRADQESEKKRRGKSKKQALPKAQLRPKRRAPLSQVLLVGGSSRRPALRRFVLNMTGLEPATLVQPDEVDTSTKRGSLL